MFRRFDELFRQKTQKMPHFVKKTRKIVDLSKTSNFSNKPLCFGVLMNFSARSGKESLISRKNGKNRRFGQNFQLFEETTVFRRFDELFSQKWQKGTSFRVKNTKNRRFGQNLKVFEETTACMFRRFDERVLVNFSAKNGKKCLISRKNRKNRRFGQNFQLFEETTVFRRFDELFSQKSKKCLISRKNTKNRRFGQNWTLFEETTVFRHFDELFSQKWQKVPHFVKKHGKSSIWPKLPTFRRNHRVSAF